MLPKYRNDPSMFRGRPFLTDGGLETSLIYLQGVDLPHFAAFVLMDSAEGRAALDAYYRPYLETAAREGTGFVLETPTWRASADWGARLGYDAAGLARVNIEAVELMHVLRDRHETPAGPVLVSGNIGPRGDGYNPAHLMTADEAEAFHRPQVAALAAAGADLITVMTMCYPAEAIGVVRAAAAEGMPVVAAFTTETDGRLPTGETLRAAIEATDAATGGAALHYMVNCAHPSHFEHALATGEAWLERIGGIRANASRMSHAELDRATELDAGNPHEFGADYRRLQARLTGLRVIGGCCGTDHRHIVAAHAACRHAA